MNTNITYCVDEEGDVVSVPAREVVFRPAVYGILIDNQRVVLERHGEKDLWRPLGGRLDRGETPSQVLQARFQAATGFAPVRGPFLLLEEQHCVDAEGRAWHLAAIYYALRRPAGSMATMGDEGPQWIPLDELAPERMLFGYRAIEAARSVHWQDGTERPPGYNFGPAPS